jgi:hypothetical protein
MSAGRWVALGALGLSLDRAHTEHTERGECAALCAHSVHRVVGSERAREPGAMGLRSVQPQTNPKPDAAQEPPRQKASRSGIGSAGKLPPPRAAECLPRGRTAAGVVAGQAHPCARHADSTVAEARALAAQGVHHRAIGKALGVAYSTVWGWLHGKRPPIERTAVNRRWRRSAKRSATETARRAANRAKARAEAGKGVSS